MNIPKRRSNRLQALVEWRRIDVDDGEEALRKPARSAGAVVQTVLSGLRIDRRQHEAEIVKAWNFLLDPALTAHAQPTGLRKGTLFVTVDNHTWLDEIVRYRRPEILKRLQASFGEEMVAKISFRVG
jgi:hypothetical protein